MIADVRDAKGRDRGGFSVVPNHLIDSGLFAEAGPTAMAVYLVLLHHTSERKSWKCHPSQETIAKKAGVSKRSVTASLAKLRSFGLVSWATKKNPYGGSPLNEYTVHMVGSGPTAQDAKSAPSKRKICDHKAQNLRSQGANFATKQDQRTTPTTTTIRLGGGEGDGLRRTTEPTRDDRLFDPSDPGDAKRIFDAAAAIIGLEGFGPDHRDTAYQVACHALTAHGRAFFRGVLRRAKARAQSAHPLRNPVGAIIADARKSTDDGKPFQHADVRLPSAVRAELERRFPCDR